MPDGDRERNRGMFGYEGEGYLRRGDEGVPPSRHRDWNIGYDTDHGPQQSYRGRGPKNYQRSDDRIREDVCERLAMDHDVDASDIEVAVAEGVVTLNGSVNERYAKRLSEDICESVRGVRDVQNNLRISR